MAPPMTPDDVVLALEAAGITYGIDDDTDLQELIAKSMLPSLTLDISDNNIPAAVERIADWMEQSGGLYMPD